MMLILMVFIVWFEKYDLELLTNKIVSVSVLLFSNF